MRYAAVGPQHHRAHPALYEVAEFRIAMNVTVAKRVKSILGVDILQLGGEAETKKPEDHLFTRLYSDPCFLVDVLYVVCKTQADAEGVTGAKRRAIGRKLA